MNNISDLENRLNIIENIKESDFSPIRPNVYEIDIPDEVKKNTPTGTNYLDEQKTYSEKKYEKIFEKLEDKLSEKQKTDIEEYIDMYRNSK
jgi:formate dehydrogenase maturation protein FdhE